MDGPTLGRALAIALALIAAAAILGLFGVSAFVWAPHAGHAQIAFLFGMAMSLSAVVCVMMSIGLVRRGVIRYMASRRARLDHHAFD